MGNREIINGLKYIKSWKCNGDAQMYEIISNAISALEKQERGDWIPCDERLPEEETDVLICNVDGDIAISRGSMSTESPESWIWYTSGWRFGNVTAWRPLGEPYKPPEK